MEQLKGIPKIACVSNEMSAEKQLISSFEYSISYICYAGIPFFEFSINSFMSISYLLLLIYDSILKMRYYVCCSILLSFDVYIRNVFV